MSVKQTSYVIWGFKAPYPENAVDDDEYYDTLEPYSRRGDNDITVILDGMSGEYVVVGHILSRSEEYDGIPMTMIPDSPESSDPVQQALYDKWEAGIKVCCDDIGIPVSSSLGWIVFTHYS